MEIKNSNETRLVNTKPIALKRNPWRYDGIITQPHLLTAPPAAEFEAVKDILHHDMVAEYDGRRFAEYLRGVNIELNPEFSDVLNVWADDEDNHYKGFKLLNEQVFGLTPDELVESNNRVANFAPLTHLLEDEFSILVLSAYDELVTVKGYQANMPMYRKFGPQFESFVTQVIKDEGWHYSKFLAMIKRYNAHRVGDTASVVAKIRAAENIPYQNTFIMDHTAVEGFFTTTMFDEAATGVVRALGN